MSVSMINDFFGAKFGSIVVKHIPYSWHFVFCHSWANESRPKKSALQFPVFSSFFSAKGCATNQSLTDDDWLYN